MQDDSWMRYAFDSDTPRDRFGGAVMAEQADAEAYVTIRVRRTDAFRIIDLIDAAAEVSAEREACALIADQYDQGAGDDSPVGPVFAAQVALAQSIAGQIRARSEAA